MTRSNTTPEKTTSADHAELARTLLDQQSSVSQPALSPDGRRTAFVVATIDAEKNKTTRRIWLDDHPLTKGPSDSAPTWSPCGRFLAFSSQRGEDKTEATLHVIPIDGPGEVTTVATRADGLGSLAWSPDGRLIAFISRTPDERYEAESSADQSPRKVEHLLSRLNGQGWIFDRPNHVFVVPADGTGTPTNLTPGAVSYEELAWAPDSAAIVTSSLNNRDPEKLFPADLFHIDLGTGTISALTSGDGTYTSPSVSPDGTRVAFVGFTDNRVHSRNDQVGVIPLNPSNPVAGKDITWVSTGLDRAFMAPGPSGPLWENEHTLLALAQDRGEQHLYRIPVDVAADPEPLTSGPMQVVALDAGRDDSGPVMVTVRTTVSCPAELYRNDERVTRVTAAVEEAALGWEKFAAPTTDGTGEIDAWIMRPANFDESATYPVLLNVHGGPFTQYGEFYFDEAQAQAKAGFVVVLGNPRGSSGRDSDWSQAILGPKNPVRPGPGWGSVDVDDVMAIITTALDRYRFCDRDRVGMLGGSYGGFMATELAGRFGDRFGAFCSERAVNNLLTMEWTSDIATMFRSVHGVTHHEDADYYLSVSPIRNIDNIDKPMLIIHSEEDWRCPISQAEELWIGLLLRGREVEFYRFPGENHELSRSGSPTHRVQRFEIILDFFAKHLAAPEPA